ncbi:hypothetical protein OGAPHI_002545 [Ogataea philodendri]|uniref:ORC6 first cyclin-like domain-containing protein n=1 Tax=Ogataea philodendri TaxID=1378263 RepID=A0A9P8PBR8_9ASCO|nr:uncharacterized protein OGAPHI_002545 [Ogataea philodendri]KAH3668790.1 hypothetical protein OGAPHI_002545 [Ogataea philodendri]
MSQFILSALQDVVPTHTGPIPKEVIDYANYLYLSSKSSCPLAAQLEIGRCHLCCFLTVDKFKNKFDLPDPSVNRIPIPKRKAVTVLADFRHKLSGAGSKQGADLLRTPTKRRVVQLATPETTPGRKRVVDLTEQTTPSKRRNVLNTPESTPKTLRNEEPDKVDAGTAAKSLQKRLLAAADDVKGPAKRGRKKGFKLLSMADRSLNDDTIITTPHLVAFCNKFYLPEEITRCILETYKHYYYRTKSPWGLLCGLVSIAYLHLNQDKVVQNMGFKTKFFKNLQIHQNGGLKYNELVDWVALVEKLCDNEKWIKDLGGREMLESETKLPFGLPTLNSFVTPRVCYFSDRMEAEYVTWINRIKQSTGV